ncbi:MAG: tetratricopeptide repeat protein [bacterium]|nr:tetratricopeptide repeat protein [bacterium]
MYKEYLDPRAGDSICLSRWLKYKGENNMKHFKTIRLILMAALIFGLAGIGDYVYGQAGRGRAKIRGLVQDESGKSVANASVNIAWERNPEIVLKTKTRKNGRFSFNGLSSGDWQIVVAAQGYSRDDTSAFLQQYSKAKIIRIVLTKSTMVIAGKKEGIDALVGEGKQLINLGSYDEALKQFQSHLETNPEAYLLRLWIANSYKKKGEFEMALEHYQKALGNAPPDGSDKRFTGQVQIAMGELYMRKSDMKTAGDYFNKALTANPNDETLPYDLGEIFFTKNKNKEAIRYFNLAASVKPGWGEPYLKIGYAYLGMDDHKNAASSFKKFLELAPQAKEASAVKIIAKNLEKQQSL